MYWRMVGRWGASAEKKCIDFLVKGVFSRTGCYKACVWGADRNGGEQCSACMGAFLKYKGIYKALISHLFLKNLYLFHDYLPCQ